MTSPTPKAVEREASGEESCDACGGKGVDPACREETCIVCGGSGVVDDGEIDCYPNGEPFQNGPIKCVKDCPACKGRSAASVQGLEVQRGEPTDAEVDAALIAHHLNVTPLSRQDMRRALTGFLKGRASSPSACVAPSEGGKGVGE